MKNEYSPSSWKPFSNFHGFVRLTLLVDWDPIGVFGFASGMDEYDSYAAEICRLIKSGSTVETITAHLDDIEKHSMGLREGRKAQVEVAEEMLEIYQLFLKDELRGLDENSNGR